MVCYHLTWHLESSVVAPSVNVNASYLVAKSGDKVQVDCIIEAFPKANSYWSKKPEPQFYRAEKPKWFANERQQAYASALGVQRDLKSLRDTQSNDADIQAKLDDNVNSNNGDQNDGLNDANDRSKMSNFQRAHRHRLLPLESVIAFSSKQIAKGSAGQTLIRASRASSGLAQATSQPSKSLVSVMQTPLNAYTYRLRLTIAQVKPDDYGEYSCVAVNPLGSSEAQVVVSIQATGERSQVVSKRFFAH